MTGRPTRHRPVTSAAGARLALTVLVLLACLTCLKEDSESSDASSGKEQIVMKETYPRLFADVRRSCCIPVISHAKGAIDAKLPLSGENEPKFEPRFLLVGDGVVVAVSDRVILGLDDAGGRRIVEKIRFRSPVQLHAGRVYFLEQGTVDNVLSAVGVDGKPVADEMFILNTFGDSGPIFIEPRDEDYLAMCLMRLGAQDGGPEMVFYTKEYETKSYIRVESLMSDAAIIPLHMKAQNRFVAFATHETVVYDVSPGLGNFEEVGRFDHPIRVVREASASEDGTIYYLGHGPADFELAAVDTTGKEIWRWAPTSAASFPAKNVQPPVVGPDGRVFVALTTKVAAIDAGKTAWEFEPGTGEAICYLTALADGTLLVTTEDSLFKVSTAGVAEFRVDFGEELNTPPVVTQDGTILVAGPTTIFRVK